MARLTPAQVQQLRSMSPQDQVSILSADLHQTLAMCLQSRGCASVSAVLEFFLSSSGHVSSHQIETVANVAAFRDRDEMVCAARGCAYARLILLPCSYFV